jgi:hypothetical protein
MTTFFRTALAAAALAFSAFVLSLVSPPDQLAGRALLSLFVVFAVGWMIAVAERATVPRGGLRVPRFPLGPRLLQVRPGLGAQMAALLVVLFVVAGPKVGIWATVITGMVTIHAVRKVSWYVVPAAWVVHTLATMPEFHTLGDLVKDAGDWTRQLVIFGGSALVVCGPLLRTDVGGRLPWLTRLVTLLAGLPAWGAAAWVFGRTALGGQYLDLQACVVILLGGSLLQSLLLGAVTWLAHLEDRVPDSVTQASAHGVGLALMPLLLPILAVASLAVLPLPVERSFGGPSEAWQGLMVVLMLVPAVAAAGLIGAALDRVDGLGRGLVPACLSGACLALWFFAGPFVLQQLYAPDGAAAALRASFDGHGGGAPLVSGVLPGSSPLSGQTGGQLALFGLPAADLCRAVTLMLFGLAALSARYVRHSRPGQQPAGWGAHLLLLALSAGAAWFLVPRLGAVGAPLACAGASALLLAVDLFHVELRVRTPEEIAAAEQAREEAETARHRAEREAMAHEVPREIVN